MKIIRKSERVTEVHYYLEYAWKGRSGSGFEFECDEKGNVTKEKLCPEALENLRKCQTGEYDVVFQGVKKYVHKYTIPAVGRCDCGAEVTLDRFINTCEKCGATYNLYGQALAPCYL